MTTDDALKEAVMQVAKAKVAEALGGDILGKMIDAVMNHRDTSTYSRDKSKTEFERIVESLIHAAIETATREVIAERRDQIISAVTAGMEGRLTEMATSVVDAFATSDWRAELKVSIDRADK